MSTAAVAAPQEAPVAPPPPAIIHPKRVELVSGVSLAPVVLSCRPNGDAKELLAENWTAKADEGAPEEGAPPAPAFNPAAPEYNELAKRLSESWAFKRWHELSGSVKALEKLGPTIADPKEREAKAAELDAARGAMAEAESALAEIKASFEPDPLSLVPWMQTLFALADAGLTSFDASGALWPHCKLSELLLPKASGCSSAMAGAEKLLGAFKKRYDLERSTGKLQIITRVVPHLFGESGTSNIEVALEAAVERSRVNIMGLESTDSLDMVQLSWLDFKEHDPLPALRALAGMAVDKVEASPDMPGSFTVTAPKRFKALGLVDFPVQQLQRVIQYGVKISSLQICYSCAETASAAAVALAKAHGIRVLASDCLMGGLISERWLGVAAPDTAAAGADTGLDSVPAAMEAVARYGGWDRLQALLRCLKGIADKHSVRMESVALRWVMDQGATPMASVRWAPGAWRAFGCSHGGSGGAVGGISGADAKVLAAKTFLDSKDIAAIAALAGAAC